MNSARCPELAEALASSDLEAATDLAAARIAAGFPGDPGVGAVALEWAARAARSHTGPGDREDVVADACVEVLRLLHEYRPREGASASAYLATWLPRVGSKSRGKQYWNDDPKLRKAAAIVSATRDDLEGHDHRVSEDYVVAVAEARAMEQIAADVAKSHPEWDSEESALQARKRFVKDGLDRAFKEIRSGADTGYTQVSLDESYEDGTLVHDIGSESSERSSAQSEELFESILGVVLGDKTWAREALPAILSCDADGDPDISSVAAAAAKLKVSQSELRALAKLSALRARSPHAHWAHLSPGLERSDANAAFSDA